MLSRSTAVAVPLALLITFVACGDDDEETTTSPTTTAASATTTTQFSGAGSEEFCAEARSYFERSTQAFTADLFAVASNPQDRAARERFRNALLEAARAGREIEPKAPAEIRDDFSYLVDAADRYREALERANFNVADPSLQASLAEPRFQAASNRFTSYLTNVCKLPIGSTIPGAPG